MVPGHKDKKHFIHIILLNLLPMFIVSVLGYLFLFHFSINRVFLLLIMVLLPLFIGPVMFFLNRRAEEAHNSEIEKLKDLNLVGGINLREINHRVKNNMNMIIALLELQKGEVGRENASLFDQPIKRIRTMALLHEKLYSSSDGSSIELAELAEEIGSSVIGNELISSGKIVLRVSKSPVVINAELATPMGMLINELITNSVKHAFPEGMSGIISMDFSAGVSFYTFRYSDNGTGFTEESGIKKGSTLGMRIIKSLSEQLGGQFSLDHQKGLSYTLVFPRDIRVEGQKTQSGLYKQMVFNRAFTDLTIELMNHGISEHSYSLVLKQAVKAIDGCDRGCILQLKGDDRFHFISAKGVSLRALQRIGSLSLNEAFLSPSGNGGIRIISSFEETLDAAGLLEERKVRDFINQKEIRSIRSTMVIPVKLDNAFLAFLYLGSTSSNAYNEESEYMARVFASQLSLIIEHFKY